MQTMNPDSDFGSPRRLIDDDSLSFDEKISLLENWKDDLEQRQRAEDENMPSATEAPGLIAQQLAQVIEALSSLSATEAAVVSLPADFIGKRDEPKLESFAAHLIAHGAATRWHWQRAGGIDVEMLIYRGGPDEELLVRIGRDHERDIYIARDMSGRMLTAGSLEAVMTIVDTMARAGRPEPPA